MNKINILNDMKIIEHRFCLKLIVLVGNTNLNTQININSLSSNFCELINIQNGILECVKKIKDKQIKYGGRLVEHDHMFGINCMLIIFLFLCLIEIDEETKLLRLQCHISTKEDLYTFFF